MAEPIDPEPPSADPSATEADASAAPGSTPAAPAPATPAPVAAPTPAAADVGAPLSVAARERAEAAARKDKIKRELAAEAAVVAGKAKPAPKAPPPAAKAPPPADDPVPRAPPWWRTLRADPPAIIRLALGATLLATVFLLWWLVTRGAATERIISPSRLPSPAEVFGALSKLLQRDLFDSIVDTLIRVFKGVGLAALVGVSIGVMAASNRGVGAALGPLVIFLRSVPMGALIPLTLLLFTQPERQKMMFLFLAIVPFVFSDTVKAISIVPERYVETAQTLGASRFQIVRKVLVPLALPDIITSLRFQLGLALGYVMLVEIIDTEHGLGKLITMSERQGLNEQVYLLLFVIALIAFGLDLLLRTLQRGVFAWRKDL